MSSVENNNPVISKKKPSVDNQCSNSLVVTEHCKSKNKKMKTKQQQRLSGFFQAQLRLHKMMKSSKKRRNLSSIKSVHNVNHMRCCTSHVSKKIENHRQRSIHDLPEDLRAEIFKLLPVKYILRCMYVQKSWHYPMQTPMFITLHGNYHRLNTAHDQHSPKYLFFRNAFNNKLTVRFDDVQCQEFCTVNYLPALPESIWLEQSYGLICVTSMFDYGSEYDPRIYLWNPLVQKYRTLPNRPLYNGFTFKHTSWTALAFGFVPEVNDYQVVHIVKPRELNINNKVIIRVYSLNTNSWKIASQDNVFISEIREKQVVFVNGAAFWLGYHSTQKIIMCFDTKTNILREILLSVYARYLRERRAHCVLHPTLLMMLNQFILTCGY